MTFKEYAKARGIDADTYPFSASGRRILSRIVEFIKWSIILAIISVLLSLVPNEVSFETPKNEHFDVDIASILN